MLCYWQRWPSLWCSWGCWAWTSPFWSHSVFGGWVLFQWSLSEAWTEWPFWIVSRLSGGWRWCEYCPLWEKLLLLSTAEWFSLAWCNRGLAIDRTMIRRLIVVCLWGCSWRVVALVARLIGGYFQWLSSLISLWQLLLLFIIILLSSLFMIESN